jgi:hypothetical protein
MGEINSSWFCFVFLGYCIGSNFWKFYLIKIDFTFSWTGFFWGKCLDCLDENGIFWCSECGHNVRHHIYWQGQHVCDGALFFLVFLILLWLKIKQGKIQRSENSCLLQWCSLATLHVNITFNQ